MDNTKWHARKYIQYTDEDGNEVVEIHYYDDDDEKWHVISAN